MISKISAEIDISIMSAKADREVGGGGEMLT